MANSWDGKFYVDQFYLFLCVDLFLLDSLVYTHTWNLKDHQLHEFATYTSSHGGNNERWQLMSKLVQFTSVHYPDLNPNSYGSLSNMKVALNC